MNSIQRDEPSGGEAVGRLSRPVFLSLRAGVASAAMVVAAAVTAGWWFREAITEFFTSTWDSLAATFGLGVVPTGLWAAALLFVLVARRSWLRHVNLWVATVALLALTLGALAFFQPYRGALSAFTLDGDVSLGGGVGSAIIGPITWLGILRLVAIAVAGLWVAAPPLTAGLAVRLGRIGVFAYVLLAMAAQKVMRNRRFERFGSRVGRSPAEDESAVEPDTGSGGPSRFTGVRADSDAFLRAIGKKPAAHGVPSTPTASFIGDAGTGADDFGREQPLDVVEKEVVEKSAPEVAPEDVPTPDLPIVGKFNKLWTSFTSQRDEEAKTASLEVSGPDEQGNGHNDLEDWQETEPEDVAVEQEKAEELAAPVQQWALPPIALLETAEPGGITDAEMQTTAETIKRTLAEYRVEVEIGQIAPGPTVTMYGLVPGWVRRNKQVKDTDEQGRPKLDKAGKPLVTEVEDKTRVKVENILSREKDLALALKTPRIRIETPVLGKSLVGIEVPNPNPALVTLRSVMDSHEYGALHGTAHLPIALGRSSGGETIVSDLAKMPHLLIAGATGSGKSACLNAIISCLVVEKTPAEVRLLLIDPKRVELTQYNGIPHLLTPVVVETDKVVGLLKGMIREMLDRYRRFEEVGVRNIEGYNRKVSEKMPFLVAAVDELADLMMSAAFDIEQSLCRLAQLGRATGIHLIVATQRPSVDVVTGLIKANFPSRISFGVTSQVDSRTILDTAGADKLLGRGDMLYLPLDASRPLRAQGVFISDREIEGLVRYWQMAPRAPVPSVLLHSSERDDSSEDEGVEEGWDAKDEFLDKAIELAQSYNKLSTSLLQRRMRIGYPRAARLMDQLEEQGIVGPSDGSKSRDVIITKV